ncbi:subunit 3 of trafficking protein particle complex [Chloropicon primus]|uniref:Trafficking protein particle complex subunit n=1 Tax=Chloropicon primus TaxID=1764295 RepID=A0A5B8MW80_9CHLO|nr:subunit 3 of trafficking protein particle complex [Chloropicon primus]UPR04021.1 subunit 3 of trafficking protein particle complex [Chloropicon primus]|mmetsp:Transcript_12861/g.36022  ORF Transcript_12861/g.36022 Transcript_12861/m.36022 type:complete len:181 (+) Transcript_12861:291-833(+)|eukprot:QDZ24813.1 subunit 3 of trafficking protein particle complex [Chloropicon primus]
MSSKGKVASSVAGERINSELFTLTYGALVRHLLLDLESPEEVNKQLDRMGQNIGVRLVDDFLAKTNTTRCRNFKEAVKTIADTGFKMFLGIDAKVTQIGDKECKMVLNDNPLIDFVELPEKLEPLSYCNLLCGVIRGALEQVSMKVEVLISKDPLKGDERFELHMKLLEYINEEYPFADD